MSTPEWMSALSSLASAFADTVSSLVAALTFLGYESPVRRRASNAAPTDENEPRSLRALEERGVSGTSVQNNSGPVP
ncbi:hypothetical protein V8C35DRAFT_284668 [Trichoderma chlorosporum]